jgi:Domain of Unknown Function (DUF1080)
VHHSLVRRFVLALVVVSLAACGGTTMNSRRNDGMPRDTVRAGGWNVLFDGRTLTGWHAYKAAMGVTTGWRVDDGAIRTEGNAHDLVSDQQYSSFELQLEWKVAKGSNSGVFYWANEGTDEIYENAPEMQVLDNDGHPDGKSNLLAAGSLYALYPVPLTLPKPIGEWNQVRIVVHGSHVQQFLNGFKTADVNFDSKEFKAKVKASKFNAWQTFGLARRGHIGLQSHGGVVWFRNIRIKDMS